MRNNMKVSFLVTYYNQAKYVSQSLDSILAIHKTFDWEILVGDDGSSDNTVDEVSRYIAKWPEHIFLTVMPREKDKKYDSILRASACRLTLLEKAAGDFFCILDGDDFYIDKDFVADAISVFEKYPEISTVGGCHAFFTDGKYEYPRIRINTGVCRSRDFIKKYYIHAGACVYRNLLSENKIETIKKIGYFDDNDIILSHLNYGDFYYLGRYVYGYRQTESSIWNDSAELERDIINMQDYYVLLQLVSNYPDEIEARQFPAIYHLFLNKKEIKQEVPREKYEKFVSITGKNTELYSLLTYEELSDSEKKKLDDWVHDMSKRHLKSVGWALLRKLIKSIVKR